MNDKTKIRVSQREFDTILAALRYWQREGLMSDATFEHEIAENGREGADAALNASEIDDLVYRINGGEG